MIYQHVWADKKAGGSLYTHLLTPSSAKTTNGLVRQYFPKKTDFDTIDQVDVVSVEKKLNSRPRKSLNFKTPEEVFFNVGLAA